MKERKFTLIEEILDDMLSINSRLNIPTSSMQDYEAFLYEEASENPNDIKVLEFGIRMLHKIYDARTKRDYDWLDTLEKETYRILEMYTFSKN